MPVSYSYYIDPFGCAKNQVDAENMMACLNSTGWKPTKAEDADIIIVNSCGFIESAKRESLEAVFAWRKLYPEKKIILAGCLAERYKEDLSQNLPEADGIFGIKDITKIGEAAKAALTPRKRKTNPDAPLLAAGNRPLLSLPGSAYVKISEGCDNRCSYCAIPLIRGGLKSRSLDSIIDECKTLLDRGIKELCIIAQDIASFGKDLNANAGFSQNSVLKNKSGDLPLLLEKISRLNGSFWVRLLYIHPDNFPLPILDILKNDSRFLPYFDLPFQHGSEKILRMMNRRGSKETYLNLIETIRGSILGAVIRTTFMTGFPGEDDEDFDKLLDFQKEARPDWMGCFAYSREEDTPAWHLKKRVPKKIAMERKKILEERQIPITEKSMDRFINSETEILAEEKIEGDENLWLGRLPCHAPEIDGSAVITGEKKPAPGSLAKCRVVSRAGLDLVVNIV